MVLDSFTVVTLLAVHLLCSGGLMVLIGRDMGPNSGVGSWAVAFMLFGASYGVRLTMGLSSMTSIPLTLAVDSVMVAAVLLFAHGMRQFVGQHLVSMKASAVTLVTFVVMHGWVMHVHGSQGRHVLLNTALFLLYGLLAGVALRARSTTPRSLQTPLLTVTVLTGVLAVLTGIRGYHIATDGLKVAYGGLYAQVYYAYGSLYALLLAMTLQWMVFVRVNGLLAEMATRDPLTRTLNRAGLDDALLRHFGNRQAGPLCVLAVDVDHFKHINDTHGHAAGDRVLQALAGALLRHVRPSDLVARTGGEEFLVCCHAAQAEQAREMAERLRAAASEVVVEEGTQRLSCTVSIGVSQPISLHGDFLKAAAAADRALYAAKAAGRNCVMVV